ncbi:MAG: hypothetical protein ACJAVI_000651 [Candidatus Azotimanducaceae bacterium]|jgi:uncharacterized protein YcaQ
MTDTIKITPKTARRLVLESQGLARKASFGRGKNAVLKLIHQLGYVQIDTISVIQRAHHHVLNTRISGYQETMLHNLQATDNSVFEYWSHAAAYLPIRDYRYYQPIMQGYALSRPRDKKLVKEIFSRIEAEGALQARDFEQAPGKKSNGWWDWKPAKRMLETLFLSGELMIKERQGFQKVYDITDRVLPENIDRTLPTDSEWARYHAAMMLRALGLASAKDIAYARSTIRTLTRNTFKPDIKKAIDELLEEGVFINCQVEEETYLALSDSLASVPSKINRDQVKFLSPFDNLVINRSRTQRLFNFDYLIECYVPEPKRKYGYFTLPILWGDELIGRMDSKADRKNQQFVIKHLYLEPDIKLTDALVNALSKGIKRFQHDQNCTHTTVLATSPPALLKQISSFSLG